MKRQLAIWGASGHALMVTDIIRLVGGYEIVGFVDDVNSVQPNARFCGYPVLGGRDCLEKLRAEGVSHLVFGFGDCEARLRLAEWSRERGFSFATAIHPDATVAQGVIVGAGTVIAAGAVVNPGAIIGEHVIVNTCASVDHECVIEDGAHICPGARLAGRVSVGRASWIGIGASVIDKTRIGAGAMVGAGAVVVRDIPDGVLAYGVPARVIKKVGPSAQMKLFRRISELCREILVRERSLRWPAYRAKGSGRV